MACIPNEGALLTILSILDKHLLDKRLLDKIFLDKHLLDKSLLVKPLLNIFFLAKFFLDKRLMEKNFHGQIVSDRSSFDRNVPTQFSLGHTDLTLVSVYRHMKILLKFCFSRDSIFEVLNFLMLVIFR